MPIETDDLIQGVNGLETKALSSEFCTRTYCSKAYYTSYHCAVEFLDDNHNYCNAINNGAYSNMGSHNKLTQFLEDHISIPTTNSNRDYKKIAYRLKSLKKIRVSCDYKLDEQIDVIQYTQSKNQLKNLLKFLKP